MWFLVYRLVFASNESSESGLAHSLFAQHPHHEEAGLFQQVGIEGCVALAQLEVVINQAEHATHLFLRHNFYCSQKKLCIENKKIKNK